MVLDAATAAQHALRAAGDDPAANLAMAEVLRLQGKPARDIKRYLDTARARPDKAWAIDLALADAMVLARDGKVDEARAAFAAIDQGDGKLETSGDVRARFHLALELAAQGKAAEARPLVDAILAAQPEHAGAKALAGKLETMVARTDPLPPEDGARDAGAVKPPTPAPPRPNPVAPGPRPAPGPGPGPEAGGDSYDRLLARANSIADSNCAKAMELYAKALEQKPNGVEALAGLGYCQIDAKQFSSAFSKFRAALAVSPRYEPALRGIAETYQQQGRKEQAIEAYKRYLEVYPDSVAAKKQLERLGGDTQAPPPSSSAIRQWCTAGDPARGTGRSAAGRSAAGRRAARARPGPRGRRLQLELIAGRRRASSGFGPVGGMGRADPCGMNGHATCRSPVLCGGARVVRRAVPSRLGRGRILGLGRIGEARRSMGGAGRPGQARAGQAGQARASAIAAGSPAWTPRGCSPRSPRR